MVGVPRLRTMDGLERMDALRPIGFGAFLYLSVSCADSSPKRGAGVRESEHNFLREAGVRESEHNTLRGAGARESERNTLREPRVT